MLGIQNILCIVHVTGFEPKGDKFLGDSYVGTCICLKDDGQMLGEQTYWSCSREVFEKRDKQLIRG